MQEEPLHLVPNDQRAVVGQQLGVVIEGDLCPWCRWQLQETFHGAPEQMRVRRVYLSEAGRCGIGTYAPSDPKSQDIADLIGTIDFQAISQYGTESDPRAYRFDGELNIANRGVMEFQEMLKLDEKFLYHLLSLSQEGNFKTGRYPLVSADEVIIGHCNEHEYQAFIQNPRNRALRSRLLVIPVPYNLDVAAEIRIYQKLLALTPTATHIAPSALEMAATVAVLSRLKEEPRPGGDRVSKLQMRSSSRVVGDGGPIEGFDGLDPRYVINRLSALVCQPVPCVDGLAVLDALVGGISRDPFVEPALREHLQEWAGEAKGIFDRRLEGDVIRAFALHWHRHLEDLYHNYLDHVVLSVRQTWEGEDRPRRGRQPDEVLLRAIEERMGVSENQKTTFREEIFFRWQRAAENGDELSYADHCGLRDALEQKLFDDLRDEVKVTTLSVNPDAETVVAIDKAVQAMMASGEYCPHCAQSAIRYVGELLNR